MALAKQKITPFLWFPGSAEVAARFYVSIFKNSKILGINHYSEGAPVPQGTVLTVRFTLEGQEFIALNGSQEFPFTEAVSFVINCKDQKEIDYYWRKLTANGGREVQCGWLKDRFGLSWQVVPAELPKLIDDGPGAERVLKAVMGMVKLDLAELRRAKKG